VRNPLKTLYFDPSLVSLLRKQPALILKLAEQQRKFLQVVIHPDKVGVSFTGSSAKLNEAMDLLKDREQLEFWIEEYLSEIVNADLVKRELAVQTTRTKNLEEYGRQLEAEKEGLKNKIARLEEDIRNFERKAQEQMMSWLMFRNPFTKIMVPDDRLFLPEARNIVIEIGDEYYLKLYFMFDWQTIRILDGKRVAVEKQLAKMRTNFQEKGRLPGRKLPWSLIAGCIGNETIYEGREKIPIRQAHLDIQTISPFLEIGKNLVTTVMEQSRKDPEPMVTFSREGIITDLREFSLE